MPGMYRDYQTLTSNFYPYRVVIYSIIERVQASVIQTAWRRFFFFREGSDSLVKHKFEFASKRRGKWSGLRSFTGYLLILLLSFGVTIFFLWKDWMPNRMHVDAEFHELVKPVFYKGSYFPISAIGEKEGLKLPLDLIQEWIDPSMVYEKSSDSVIITTKNKVLQLKTSELTARLNDKPYRLQFPIEKKDGKVYVPIEPLKQLYQIELRESESTGVIILVKAGDALQWGIVNEKGQADDLTALRNGPSTRMPIVSEIAPNEKVIIWKEEKEWYLVQQTNGYTGYVPKSSVRLDHVETIPRQEPEDSFVPWKPAGGKLNVTWEHVITKNPDVSKIPVMPGLNVISPTWFSLSDGDGNINNLADLSYVKWAQSRGYQVWALFSNGFEPKRTTEALSTYEKRMNMTKQLLSFAQMYQLKGINIDFENVETADKENLVQFVREMTPFLHEQGLMVSIDVTPKSGSEMWSLFYDRQALSQMVDYMMVMTYDEHWASSPAAGSVASLPWVENSVRRLLQEDKVPSSKLVLGIPFYTRIWTEEMKDGKSKVSSKAISMEAAQKIIKDRKLTPVLSMQTGQNYVEYQDGDKLNKIWLEDETSVKARAELVKKYDLAGIASWRRGFEKPEVWNVIQQTLDNKP